MKKALKIAKEQLKKVTTVETPNKGIVAGERGSPGKHMVIEEESYYKASSSGKKVNLAFEPELEEKSHTTSTTDEEEKTSLNIKKPINNKLLARRKLVKPPEWKPRSSSDEEIISEASQAEQKPRSDSNSDSKIDLPATVSEPLKFPTKTRPRGQSQRKMPSKEHRRKMSVENSSTILKEDSKSSEAKSPKGRFRQIEEGLSLKKDTTQIKKYETLGDLSVMGREESKDGDVKKEFPQLTQVQTIIIADNHYNDSDSGVDLPGSNSEQNSESPINSRSASVSSNHVVEEIIESFNPLLKEIDSMLLDSKRPETPTKKQSSDRNPNVTLAICYLAACCCFIAVAFKGSGMLFLIGTAFLITAVVIEWQTPPPSRELTSPSSSPFIDGEAVGKP